jgi:hypothetical protein
MISVPVRGDEMIDLGELGILRRTHDAVGIPLGRIGCEIPRIDEHRFPGRGHKQRRIAAFDVHNIDIESGLCLRDGTTRSGGDERRQARNYRQQMMCPHRFLPSFLAGSHGSNPREVPKGRRTQRVMCVM